MTALPKLVPENNLSADTRKFVNRLQEKGFAGDIDITYSSRLAVATDNSIYQQLPQAVLFPKEVSDLQKIASLSSNMPALTFSARGGGTGTNGQSLTPGLVVDTSKYMNEILELNLEEEWVKVQSGVVKDVLNDYLAPHGYFFSPDLSTSNRATIGGMISTDASGQGSLVYGKTSDHLLALQAVIASGDILDTKAISIEEAQTLAKQATPIGRIYKQILDTCTVHRDAIVSKFPRLNRFLTGYDLEHAYSPQSETIDAGRLIAGAEGSLAFIAEAKLNITKIPQHTSLVNVKYNDFESALRHAPSMIKANATSVETVDSKVLNLAREDIVWHSVSALIKDVPGKVMDGLNMVEYNSNDKAEIDVKIASLCNRLDDDIANDKNGVIGYQVTNNKADIKKIYTMRKQAVGLLGNTKGSKKPIAFTEDTAVPPENLADFIMEFRALLDAHELDYGMFGHVDAGVLHVRPALDLCDPKQEALVNKISDQVVALVSKYGGLMWGEHGKGYRSEYAPEFFGESLYAELRKIKAAFDPHNQMNPGKICTPYGSDHRLVSVSDTKRASFDREIPVVYKQEFEVAMSCNGNGLCFNYDTTSPMCPSSKITQDRRHSPKGRAGLVREWLYQLSQQESPIDKVEAKLFSSSFVKKIGRKFAKSDDFNHEVFDAMNGCLACKSCSNQCPVGVDVPDFRSKFLAIYYTRYLRPLKDYFVANVETITPLMAKSPRIFNALIGFKPNAWLLKHLIGYIDTPMLSHPPLTKRVDNECMVLSSETELTTLANINANDKSGYVIIVQDPFTSYYDAEVVEKLIQLCTKMGLKPILLPFSPNGKPQHVKGFLSKFERTALKTSQFLSQVGQLNIPMVGADASLVLCYRDEYSKISKIDSQTYKVLTISEWLAKKLTSLPERKLDSQNAFRLLAHCSEKTAIPETEAIYKQAFNRLGLTLEIAAVGCCGMAGTYGHELEHFENSKGIYELSWHQHAQDDHRYQNNDTDEALNAATENTNKSVEILATGYSCRSQVKRFAQYRPKHPIEVLADLI